jgi:hypothetical protein
MEFLSGLLSLDLPESRSVCVLVDSGGELNIVGAEELFVDSNLGERKLSEAVLKRVAGVFTVVFERVDILVFSDHVELRAVYG